MAKPTAGSYYTVVSGDKIRSIARRAYGYDRSADVVSANYEKLNGRETSLEGLPTIYAGDKLWLPDKSKEYSETVDATVDDEIAIRIDGQVFRGWTASNISRSINTIADGFTFSFPFDPTDETLIELTRPYSYKKCELFIGGDLYISGQCIKWSTASRTNQTMKTIDVRTKAGHTIECMAQNSAYEQNGLTLSEIAEEIMAPYGDDLSPVFTDGDSDEFPKVRKEMTESDFSFLSNLAAQKGFLITSYTTGEMAFIQAAVDGSPVFSFEEGVTAIEHISASYDGQKVFSSLTAVTESAGTAGPSSTLENDLVPIYRPFVFSADDLESGNLDSAIEWKRSKALAESAPVSVTVTGWRNKYGQLWEENMVGSVYWPSIDIYTKTDYIVASVNLKKDENGGNVSVLTLVLPQAYTLDYPDSFPWEDA